MLEEMDGECNGKNIYDIDSGDYDEEPLEPPEPDDLVNQNKPMGNEVSTKDPVSFEKIKNDYDDGQTVMTIAGTITALYPVKKGGDWEYQNGKMKDRNGEEIDISFSKNTQPDSVKGQKVVIRSVKHEKHGWLGVKVEDQNYEKNGEQINKRVLKIVASANIEFEGKSGGSKPQSSQSQNGDSGKYPHGAGQTQQQSSTHPEPVLQDLISLHMRCRSYAEQAYPDLKEDPEAHTPAQNNESLRAQATASIFIEASKMGLAWNFTERVSAPIPQKIAPPPKDPKNWRQCQIPKGEMVGKTLADLTEEQLTKLFDAVKESTTAFAGCVRYGFDELGYLKKRQDAEAKQRENDKALEPETEEDDIPF